MTEAQQDGPAPGRPRRRRALRVGAAQRCCRCSPSRGRGTTRPRTSGGCWPPTWRRPSRPAPSAALSDRRSTCSATEPGHRTADLSGPPTAGAPFDRSDGSGRTRGTTGSPGPSHAGPVRVVIAAEQARAYDEDGYFVLEDAFDPADGRAHATARSPRTRRRPTSFLRCVEGGRISVAPSPTRSRSRCTWPTSSALPARPVQVRCSPVSATT